MHPEMASSLLTSRIAAGESLVAAASLIDDLSDHAVWTRRRAYWIEESSDLLLRLYGESGALADFREAVAAAPEPGEWRRCLPSEIERTRTSVDQLRALLAQLPTQADAG